MNPHDLKDNKYIIPQHNLPPDDKTTQPHPALGTHESSQQPGSLQV